MIGDIFYWTGALVWACIGGALVWLAIEIVIAFCSAVSFFRWIRAVQKEHSIRALKRPVRAFFKTWVEHIGYRNDGSERWSGPGGYWRGIGDNLVLPRVEDESPKVDQ